jgi:cyclopropane fatty-acyl-phospholipid synthase-like methyltransferase
MTTFKDLFSKQSADYVKFRPTYPPELYHYLSTLVAQKNCAWDCGTGNGQAAIELAGDFKRVIATDLSEQQLSNAIQKPNIEYRVASAENSGLAGNSVDLVTVAQAFHWFNQELFYKEVERVVHDRGVLAVWSYALAKTNPRIDALVLKIYEDILGPYWEKERKLVDEGYKKVKFPFEELIVPKFRMQKVWSLDHFVGYLNTWSALQTYIKKNGQNPLESMGDEFVKTWGWKDVHVVTWEISLRVFRLK